MKSFLFITLLLLTSCASTVVRSLTGVVLFRTHADAAKVDFYYKSAVESITFLGLSLNHSLPTAMAWDGSSKLGGAIGLITAPFAPGATAATRIIAPMGAGASQFHQAPVSPTPTPK